MAPTTTTTAAPTTTTAAPTTTTSTTAAPATTTTIAAVVLPTDSDDSFLAGNWWWLTIIGLALIALIATLSLLQPQREGLSARYANGAAGARPAGRHVKKRNIGVTASAPTVGQRVRRTKVAQSITMRGAQPKPPKPSRFRRMTNWFRDTELADSFRARSEARQVKARASQRKPPRIKRRR